MKEIFITSSVLILALLLLRFCFRNFISQRVQYALWLLVVLRLLIPVELPGFSLSVLNFGQQTQKAVSNTLEQNVYLLPIGETPASELPSAQSTAPGEPVETGDSFGYPILSQDGQIVTKYATHATLSQVLGWVWKVGMVLTALFFLSVNLMFWKKLRQNRTPYPVEGCTLPVYLCENLHTPCLFGLFFPAIYLTPEVISSPQRLEHVLLHEKTHARHLDPMWSVLRCVCLSVYWFHPLVWVAAVVSRTDCELACDEGAVCKLNHQERLEYGHTLLALIQVKHTPTNPLLTATTMNAGKKQLKDRLTHIAHRSKPALTTGLAVVLLAGLAGACTFTAPQEEHAQKSSGSLTGEELRYFNEEFFNGDGFNLRNQFLSSLYKNPKEIDLFELFYNGDGIADDTQEWGTLSFEALDSVLGLEDAPCPATLLTQSQMDAILSESTGLLLEETNQENLSLFQYDESNQIYYYVHGDTNYRSFVYLSAGTREGDQISLYYLDEFYGDGWKCVTLQDMGDGSYQFRSNVLCEKPSIATVYPDEEPEYTIPLHNLTPYETPVVTVEPHTDDCEERLGGYTIGEHSVRLYRSTDGNVYAAVVYNEAAGADGMAVWDVGCFLTLPAVEGYDTISFFSDLFGQSGIVIRYTQEWEDSGSTTYHNYYTFTEDGIPILLAQVYGADSQIIDLNGDGTNELVGTEQIFFQRDGQVYEANLQELLHAHQSISVFWGSAQLDPYSKAILVNGLRYDGTEQTEDGFYQHYTDDRYQLYFDGDAIRIY